MKAKKKNLNSWGFPIQIRERSCYVNFEKFNDKVIRCKLHIEHPLLEDNGNAYEVTATSKLNEQDDVFDQKFGEILALSKAIDKYVRTRDKELDKDSVKQERFNNDVYEGLIHRVEKRYSKKGLAGSTGYTETTTKKED